MAEPETPLGSDAAAQVSDQSTTGLEPKVDAASDPPPRGGDEIAMDARQADDEPTALAFHDSAAAAATPEGGGASDPAVPAADEAAIAAEASTADVPVTASPGAVVDLDLPQVAPTTAEPELVEVWRPGGRSEERRGQRRSPQWQRARQTYGGAAVPDTTAGRAIAAEGKGEPVVGADTSIENKGPPHRRPHSLKGELRAGRDDGREQRQKDHRAERQGDRTERARGERPHFAKARNEHKDRRDYAPHREREKQVDPNSPFAKLAALKAQLEAAAKERR